MKIVIMGAPGGGKGSQCPAITERYGICHLSTGDMLRAAVKSGSPTGKKVKSIIDAGKLVSNDVVFEVVKESMEAPECSRGWVLDGLPRTVEQAQLMDRIGFGVERVINLQVPDDVLIKRICGRWIHQPSGRSYHTQFKKPQVAGKDDVTGEDLVQRADDNEATARKRLKTFHEQTVPIFDYYRDQRKFDSVNGATSMRMVTAAIFGVLDRFFTPVSQ